MWRSLGRFPGTDAIFSTLNGTPEHQPPLGVLAFRPEGSLLYLNAEYVLARIMERLDRRPSKDIRIVVRDLPAAPRMDSAGASHVFGTQS